MARAEKVEAVKDISARFSAAEAALLAEYRGLSVGEMGELRGSLQEAGAELKVLKNTLARIAAREVGLDDLTPLLQGPIAIAFCRDDAVQAAKALDDAARRFPVVQIKGGVLRGKVLDEAQARALATVEPREVQLARVAMLFNSPAQQTVNVVSALLRNLGSMLAQVVDSKQAASATEAA